jgi:hypothetical protein
VLDELEVIMDKFWSKIGSDQWALLMDAGSKEEIRRDLWLAVREAPDNARIFMRPGTYLLGKDPHRGKTINIGRNLSIHASRAKLFGRSIDGESTFFIRNQDNGVEFTVEGLNIDAGRIPDTEQDSLYNCIVAQAGKPGTKTRVNIDECEMSHANGALHVISGIFGEQPDEDLEVEMLNSVIHSMFEDRQSDGTKLNHSGGVYQDGGIMHLGNNWFHNLGWVPGSRLYKKHRMNQAVYKVRGFARISDNLIEDCAHGGLALRAGETVSTNNIIRRTPLAFQAGHFLTPWQAVVTSDGDRVEEGSDIVNSDGAPEITCGFSLEAPASVTIRNFSAWNQSGRGDWGGFHVRAVRPRAGRSDPEGQSVIDIDPDSIDVGGWGNNPVVIPDSQMMPEFEPLVAKYRKPAATV